MSHISNKLSRFYDALEEMKRISSELQDISVIHMSVSTIEDIPEGKLILLIRTMNKVRRFLQCPQK